VQGAALPRGRAIIGKQRQAMEQRYKTARLASSLGRLWKKPRGVQLLVLEAAATLAQVRMELAFWPYSRLRNRLLSARSTPFGRAGRGEIGAGARGEHADSQSESKSHFESVHLNNPRAVGEQVASIAWAVKRVGELTPRLLACLPRAISVCRMLERRGYQAKLMLGVGKDEHGKFTAHAWVVYEGEVIVGQLPNLDSFVKLSSWPHASQAGPVQRR